MAELSEEVFSEIWKQDLLGRSDDAKFLLNFLLKRVEERAARGDSRSFVLNLDAGWGHGKSFFLQRFAETVNASGHIVAIVNAWADDHAEDPLLPVMAAIDSAVAPLIQTKANAKKSWTAIKKTTGNVALAALKGAATQVAKKAIGEGVNDILKHLEIEAGGDALAAAAESATSAIDKEAEKLLSRFVEKKRSVDNFSQSIGDFIGALGAKGKAPPMFVFVDELDRCRPAYAISLLERVKHLFNTKNIVFVFATNSDQLRHAIRAVYGSEFDSTRYLFRFFDQTYSFERPRIDQYCKYLIRASVIDEARFSVPNEIPFDNFVTGAFSFFGIGLRDAEQIIDIVQSASTVWDHARLKIELGVLLPLAIAQQQRVAPIEISNATHERLVAFARQNNGDPNAWNVPYRVYSSEGARVAWMSGLAIFDRFASLVATSFPDIRDADGDEISQWLHRRFSEEFLVLHGNSYAPRKKPYSIMANYPELVRSAGRISPFKPASS